MNRINPLCVARAGGWPGASPRMALPTVLSTTLSLAVAVLAPQQGPASSTSAAAAARVGPPQRDRGAPAPFGGAWGRQFIASMEVWALAVAIWRNGGPARRRYNVRA